MVREQWEDGPEGQEKWYYGIKRNNSVWLIDSTLTTLSINERNICEWRSAWHHANPGWRPVSRVNFQRKMKASGLAQKHRTAFFLDTPVHVQTKKGSRCRCQHPNTFVKYFFQNFLAVFQISHLFRWKIEVTTDQSAKVPVHHNEQPNFGISEKYLLDAIASTTDFLLLPRLECCCNRSIGTFKQSRSKTHFISEWTSAISARSSI
jgi:hypothetical protein